MKRISRRFFLKGSASAAVAASTFTAASWAQVAGSNEDIRIAVVGFGGRGGDHISSLVGMKGVRLIALCDADQNIIDRAVKNLTQPQKDKQGNERPARVQKIDAYQDVRKLLDRKDLDAISTATPNHWHSLLGIWACQAGKDAYIEKPISHNVWEGRKLVEAARKYNRIIQTGTQCRSSRGLQEAFKWLWEGNLGKIKLVRGTCYKGRGSIGKSDGPQPIPAGIDYDLWCGPAPLDPLRRKRLHYDWHWVWSTGNGDLGNQGIHQMDLARWIIREDHLSPRVFSVGGRLGYIDDGETPNTQFVFHDYPTAPLIFEVRGLKTEKYRGAGVGVVVDCEDGWMLVPSYSDAIAYDKQNKEIKKFSGGGDHFANWLKAVRSRNIKDLNSEALEGHLSSALCHTGNVSYRLGVQKGPDEIREQIKASPAAVETFNRMAEHLAQNNVDITKTPCTIGPVLTMNPETEKFTGALADEANKLATRIYRKPYVVPEQV